MTAKHDVHETNSVSRHLELDVLVMRAKSDDDSRHKVMSLMWNRLAPLAASVRFTFALNRDDEDDIHHASVMGALEAIEKYKPERGCASSYIFLVASQRARDEAKRIRSQRSNEACLYLRDTSGEYVEIEVRDERGQDFESQILANDVHKIDDAMRLLPASYREVLMLHYYEGHSHTQISQRLGCSLGVVKNRIKQAKAQLSRIVQCPDNT